MSSLRGQDEATGLPLPLRPQAPNQLLAWAIQETDRVARQIANVAQVLLAMREASNGNGPGPTATVLVEPTPTGPVGPPAAPSRRDPWWPANWIVEPLHVTAEQKSCPNCGVVGCERNEPGGYCAERWRLGFGG
jgi:hypothetical protein